MEDAVKNEKNINLFRIGTFAKYMGVTPDFLKHYEQNGLIRPQQSESGYRYYRFREAVNILSCMCLKTQGFTVREMDKLLHGADEDEIIAMLGEKIGAMESRISFDEDVIREFRSLEACINNMHGKDSDWWISSTDTMYFLPHTRARDFIDDGRIYELVPHWVKCMPLVHSASLVQSGDPEMLSGSKWFDECVWGLIATEETVKRHNLPLNDVVVRLPAAKCLSYHFKKALPLLSGENSSRAVTAKKLRTLGLQPGDYMLNINYFTSHIHSDRVSYNERFVIPVREE